MTLHLLHRIAADLQTAHREAVDSGDDVSAAKLRIAAVAVSQVIGLLVKREVRSAVDRAVSDAVNPERLS